MLISQGVCFETSNDIRYRYLDLCPNPQESKLTSLFFSDQTIMYIYIYTYIYVYI